MSNHGIGSRKRREILKDKFAAQGGRCFYCHRQMLVVARSERDPLKATVEHLVPRRNGGTNNPSNLVLACRECNENVRGDRVSICNREANGYGRKPA